MELEWTGLANGAATIYFDGSVIATGETSPFTHNLESKGGGSYSYQVCEADGDPCSAVEDAVF